MAIKTEQSADFLTVDEAAQLVGLSHWTIRNYLRRRLLTKYRLSFRTMVNRQELLELVHVEKIVPADVSRPAKGAVEALTAPIPKKEQEK